MSNRTLKITFGICLFIILCLGGFSYKYLKNLADSHEEIKHTYLVNHELENILSLLKDAENGQKGFLLSRDSLALQPLLYTIETIPKSLNRLSELTKNNKLQQENLIQLKQSINDKLSSLENTISTVKFDKVYSEAFKELFEKDREKMNVIKTHIVSMMDLENSKLLRKQSTNDKVVDNMPVLQYLILILILALLLLTYSKINKDLKQLKIQNRQLLIFKESVNQAEIIGNFGNWRSYIAENRSEYSDNLYRILGEEPQSFEPNLESFMEFVHPEDQEFLADQGPKMLEGKDLTTIDFRIVRKDGEIRHLRAYGKAMDITSYEQIIGLTKDITEDVMSVRLLEQRNQELEQNNRELSAFNYVASHDLQEPLRKIQTFTSRLGFDNEDETIEKNKLYTLRIEEASSRMRSLIDDLLQYSRTNKSEKKFVNTDLNDSLEHAKLELSDTINITKTVITHEELPKSKVIPFQIQQLFINLLGNSIKYSHQGISPKINITYKLINSSVEDILANSQFDYFHRISFQDNGIGFDQQYADKIFVLFSRLHGKKEYSGTGIGLSICKKIVDNHNGFIQAESELNKGAKFIIFLPLI